MNYFVSIGDCYYHKWQIEILIKSFENLGLKESLFIAKSTTNPGAPADNFYYLEDKGLIKQYYKYNKWYALYYLLNKNIIKFPVVVLEPHSILVSPIKDINYNISFQISDFRYSEDYFININDSEDKKIKEKWLPLGDTIIFNELDINFFINILNKIEYYSLNLKNYKILDKISIIDCIYGHKNHIKINSRQDLESDLYQNELNNIINYRTGFKSIFNKSYYKNEDSTMADKNLKDKISDIRYTKSLDFFYSVLN